LCHIELPAGYDPESIDLESLVLSSTMGTIQPTHFPRIPWVIGDYDGDGVRDLVITFDYSDVAGLLGPGSLPLVLEGLVGYGGSAICCPVSSIPFVGTYTPGKDQPADIPPAKALLSCNYADEAASGMRVEYAVTTRSRITLRIYDRVGRSVMTLADCDVEPGRHTIFWNGKDSSGQDLRAGVYFCKLSGRTHMNRVFMEVRKVVLLR
jgi:hypothetical protein